MSRPFDLVKAGVDLDAEPRRVRGELVAPLLQDRVRRDDQRRAQATLARRHVRGPVSRQHARERALEEPRELHRRLRGVAAAVVVPQAVRPD